MGIDMGIDMGMGMNTWFPWDCRLSCPKPPASHMGAPRPWMALVRPLGEGSFIKLELR